ncbi:MAG: hypothetical protein P8172_12520 [Gammaproteobacteria bacterium]|jgi:hypothetical protein
MKHGKTTGLIGGLIVGLTLSAGAFAQGEKTLDFEITDTNGDACVTWEELRNRSMDVYGAMDLNHDGFLTGEELPGVTGDSEAARVSIDLTRFQAALANAYAAADKDDDGCLGRAEFSEDD